MPTNSTAIPVRYITGENDPFTGVAFPTKGCFPAAIKLQTLAPADVTATTVASNKQLLILSSSNYNRNLLRAGMYVYVAGQNLAIKIKMVDFYGKTVQLEKPFPTDLAAEVVYLAKAFSNKEIRIKSSGTVNAIVQGVDMRPAEEAVFTGALGVAPIAYDASALNTELIFNITR